MRAYERAPCGLRPFGWVVRRDRVAMSLGYIVLCLGPASATGHAEMKRRPYGKVLTARIRNHMASKMRWVCTNVEVVSAFGHCHVRSRLRRC